MGQLFDRISLTVRANLNNAECEDSSNDTGEGAAFIAGGATVGAGISATVGGMGLLVAGTGMAPVAAAGAVVGLGAYGLNQLLEQGTDEEECLDRAIAQMQEALLQLRLAVVKAVALQKRTQQQYAQAQAEVDKWHKRVQLALQKGDENLARQALICKKTKAETAKALKAQLKQQRSHSLQCQLRAMEENLEQAKIKRDELKARLAAAKAELQRQSSIRRLGTSSAMGAFERMEEKVLEMEARSQAAYELTGNDLEQQFAQLESGSDVDDELARMKAELTGSPKPQEVLPSSREKASSSSDSAVDEELEAKLYVLTAIGEKVPVA